MELTNSPETNLYVRAANGLGLKVEILDTDFGYVRISNASKAVEFYFCACSVNNAVSARLVANKFLNAQVLKAVGVSVPDSMLINFDRISEYKNAISEFAGKYGKLVVKPLSGKGGEGVLIVDDKSQLDSYINECAKYGNQILIEEFAVGDNYRVLTLGNEVIDILLRIPAYVIGDGIRTINQLIEEKNIIRRRLEISPIKIDAALKLELQSLTLTLDSVVEANKYLKLRENCNMSTGGETKRVDLTKVPTELIGKFKTIAKATGLNLSGIDLITPDIYKFEENGYHINEVNSKPSMSVHALADMKYSLAIPEQVIKNLFLI